jgi:hypothetical protein
VEIRDNSDAVVQREYCGVFLTLVRIILWRIGALVTALQPLLKNVGKNIYFPPRPGRILITCDLSISSLVLVILQLPKSRIGNYKGERKPAKLLFTLYAVFCFWLKREHY